LKKEAEIKKKFFSVQQNKKMKKRTNETPERGRCDVKKNKRGRQESAQKNNDNNSTDKIAAV
jgi:hypothetical protein